MAKFYGNVGYIETVKTSPGVWSEKTTVRKHAGEVLTSSRRYENGQGTTNDDLVLSSRLSIVADSFARANFSMIKWVELWGVKWKVTNIEVLYPRLVLSFGGVWGEEDEDVEDEG